MPPLNFFDKIINGLWRKYENDAGKSLIHLGAIGWFFSGLAQIVMIGRNKNIDKKEKKFLIPQEIADCAINVGLYYTICQTIKKTGDKLLEKAYMLPKETFDALSEFKKPSHRNILEMINDETQNFKINEPDGKRLKANVSTFLDTSIKYLEQKLNKLPVQNPNPTLDSFVTTEKITEKLNSLKGAQKAFVKCKNGVGVLTAVAASVLSCNIMTPVARNITANYFQRKLLKNQDKEINRPVVSYRSRLPQTFQIFKI